MASRYVFGRPVAVSLTLDTTILTGNQVELPYRYLAVPGSQTEPLMAPGMRDIIYGDFDRTFEFDES